MVKVEGRALHSYSGNIVCRTSWPVHSFNCYHNPQPDGNMSFSWLLASTTPRQLCRLVPARIVAVPNNVSIFRPYIRSFASTPSSKKSRETKKPKEEDVEEVEQPEHLPTEPPSRRIVDNNNPQPAISLPGGLSWPFQSSSATDAALTTLVGLGLGLLFFFLSFPLLYRS